MVSDLVEKSWGQGRKTGKIVSCLVGDDTGEIRLIGFNAIGNRVRSFLIRDGIIELSNFVCQVAKENFRTTILKLEIMLSLSTVVKTVSNISKEVLTFTRS